MAQYINPSDYGYVGSGIIPVNLNEEQFIAFAEHNKGGFMQFPYLQAAAPDPSKWDYDNRVPILDGSGNPVDPTYLPPYRTAPGLLDLHPLRMRKNMMVSVQEGFQIATYVLRADPSFITYREITIDNYRNYWSEVTRVTPQYEKEVQYALEYDGSLAGWPDTGRPPYDDATATYPAIGESLWHDVEDASRDRWYRYRTATYDIDGNQIVSDYSPPIPINKGATLYVKVKNIFIRNGTKSGSPTTAERPTTPGPITISGLPNNLPDGWSDNWVASPVTEYAWVSRALVDIQGNINTELGWSIPAYIPDDENLLRFSETGTPHPKTIVDTTDDASDGSAGDTALLAAGWVQPASFDPDVHNYIATRQDLGGGNYSVWLVEDLTGEDQSYKVIRYKLLPIYADWDNDTWADDNRPVGIDPSDDGWVTTLASETNFLVNYYSEAWIYANGNFKSNWSDPRPWTNRDTYNDYISIHPDDSGIDATKQISGTIVKRFQGGTETHDPESLWLRANLILGLRDIISDASVVITYQWNKIYAGGAYLDPVVDEGTSRDLHVDNTDVDGRNIYQVVMTMDDAPGYHAIADAITDGSITGLPTFTEEIDIIDQVDGKDGRTLSVNVTPQQIIRTGAGPYALTPTITQARANGDNIDLTAIEWYLLQVGADPLVEANWDQITATTDSGASTPVHTWFEENRLLIHGGDESTEATDIFASTTERWFKAVYPAVGAQPAMEDWIQVIRIDQTSLATGENAVNVEIDKPTQQVKVDEAGIPISGEFDRVINIQLWDGSTRKVPTDYTTSLVSIAGPMTDTGNVTIDGSSSTPGDPTTITITNNASGTLGTDKWDNSVDNGRLVVVIRVTYGGKTYDRTLLISSVLEPYGFTGMRITSDRGTFTFDYSANGSDDIVMTSIVIRQAEGAETDISSDFTFVWSLLSGSYTGSLSTTEDQTISRADVTGSAVLQCLATKIGAPSVTYSATIRINDVPDSRAYLLASTKVTQPTKPANDYSTYPATDPGAGGWYTDLSKALWESINTNGGEAGYWSEARRVGFTTVYIYRRGVTWMDKPTDGTLYSSIPATSASDDTWTQDPLNARWKAVSHDYGEHWYGPESIPANGTAGVAGTRIYLATTEGVNYYRNVTDSLWTDETAQNPFNTTKDYRIHNVQVTGTYLTIGVVYDYLITPHGFLLRKTDGTNHYWRWTGICIIGTPVTPEVYDYTNEIGAGSIIPQIGSYALVINGSTAGIEVDLGSSISRNLKITASIELTKEYSSSNPNETVYLFVYAYDTSGTIYLIGSSSTVLASNTSLIFSKVTGGIISRRHIGFGVTSGNTIGLTSHVRYYTKSIKVEVLPQ